MVAQTKTRRTICTIRSVVDVVLEETLSAVVCKALSQLDNGDEVCSGRQVFANAAESAPLMLSWLLSIGGGFVVRWLCSVGSSCFLVDGVGLSDVTSSY